MEKRYIETGYRKNITEDQVRQLKEFVEKECVQPVQLCFKFMLKGLRVSDACRVQLTNIDWQNKKVNLIQYKTQWPVTVWLDEDFFQYLKAYCLIFKTDIEKHNNYLCFSPYNKFDDPDEAHIQESSCRAVWKKFRDAFGFTTPYYTSIDGKQCYELTNHVLRRRAVNKAMDLTHNDLRVAQKIAGHKCIESTLAYLNEAPDAMVRDISAGIN